jgi:hypothetical protein
MKKKILLLQEISHFTSEKYKYQMLSFLDRSPSWKESEKGTEAKADLIRLKHCCDQLIEAVVSVEIYLENI